MGRRRVFLESLALFGVGSLVAAAAWSFPALLLGRAIQAFGAGGLLPVAAAVIAETVPLERRGRTLGLIGAVFGVAFLLGPLLGGLLLRSSWRWLFVVNVPVVLALMAAGARILPLTVPRRSAAVRCGRRSACSPSCSRPWSSVSARSTPAPGGEPAVGARLAVLRADRDRRAAAVVGREARRRSRVAAGVVALAAATRRRRSSRLPWAASKRAWCSCPTWPCSISASTPRRRASRCCRSC